MGTTTTTLRYHQLLPDTNALPTFQADTPRPWTGTGVDEWTSGMSRHYRRLLRESANDPGVVLKDRRCIDEPLFRVAFLELCRGWLDVGAPQAWDGVRAARALAQAANDPHLERCAETLSARARQDRGDAAGAVRTLHRYRRDAFGCCPGCTAESLLQSAVLLTLCDERYRDAGGAEVAFEVLEMGRGYVDPDDTVTLGRFDRVEVLAYRVEGNSAGAVEAAGRAFRRLPLSAADEIRATIRDLSLALVNGTAEDDAAALGVLAELARRHARPPSSLRGAATAVHHERRWLSGLLEIRLGRRDNGIQRLDRLGRAVDGVFPATEVAALLADQVMAICRHGGKEEAAAKRLQAALDRSGLQGHERKLLSGLLRVLDRRPEDAFDLAAEIRRQLDARIANLLAGRPHS